MSGVSSDPGATAPAAAADPTPPQAPNSIGDSISASRQSGWDAAFADATKELNLDPETLDPIETPSEPTAEETAAAEKEAAEKAESELKPFSPQEEPEPTKTDEEKAAEAKAAEDKKAEDIKKLEGKSDEELAKLASVSEEDLAKIVEAEAAKNAQPEKSDAEIVLELLRDPATLEAALRQNGVEKIQDLPVVKDLLGRATQSAEDRVKAEIAKQQWQQQAVQDVAAKGQKAYDDVAEKLDALAKEIADDVDGTAELHIPDKDWIKDKMKEFSDAQVNAYHNSTWGDLADMIYGLPELNAAAPEIKAELAKFAGRPPKEWLGAHLEAARQTLWQMAQGQVAEAAQKAIADAATTTTAAHKVELEKLTAKYEKAQKSAIDEARKTARAEAIAEFSKNGPPKIPAKDTSEEGALRSSGTAKTIAEIFAETAREAEATGV